MTQLTDATRSYTAKFRLTASKKTCNIDLFLEHIAADNTLPAAFPQAVGFARQRILVLIKLLEHTHGFRSGQQDSPYRWKNDDDWRELLYQVLMMLPQGYFHGWIFLIHRCEQKEARDGGIDWCSG